MRDQIYRRTIIIRKDVLEANIRDAKAPASAPLPPNPVPEPLTQPPCYAVPIPSMWKLSMSWFTSELEHVSGPEIDPYAVILNGVPYPFHTAAIGKATMGHGMGDGPTESGLRVRMWDSNSKSEVVFIKRDQYELVDHATALHLIRSG